MGNQLLARTSFTQKQHRSLRLGHLPSHPEHLGHGGPRADDAPEGARVGVEIETGWGGIHGGVSVVSGQLQLGSLTNALTHLVSSSRSCQVFRRALVVCRDRRFR